MATMTAAARRTRAKHDYDAFLAACPSRKLLDRISDKWVTLVLAALGDCDDAGEPVELRFSELARRLAGISQKMLTQTLRTLERDGLISRRVTPSVPVRVDYALTPLGRSLQAVVEHLKSWAEANMDAVIAARQVYDAEPVR